MNQNIFCSKCYRIPSQCCCSSEWGMNKEIIMNPDILPTEEEWRLVCKMVKQKQAEIEALKKEIEDDEWTKDKLILKAKKRIMHDFNNALIEIQKASEK